MLNSLWRLEFICLRIGNFSVCLYIVSYKSVWAHLDNKKIVIDLFIINTSHTDLQNSRIKVNVLKIYFEIIGQQCHEVILT